MSRQVSAAYSIFSHPPPSPPISTTSSECGVPPSQEPQMANMPSENRRKSAMTDYSTTLSAMPSEISLNTSDSDPYTPLKRTPLRESSSRSARWSAHSGTPTRKSYADGLETPRSATSQSVRSQSQMVKRAHTPGSRAGTPSMEVGTPSQRDKHPLVLLHATLLPVSWPYSLESMAAVLPDYILENFRLLQSKLNDVTIMGRGVLISHPRNEYEVLEESILETLELIDPRVLKCGHFGMDDGDQDHKRRSRRESSASQASDGTVNGESHICDECNELIKHPNSGVGAGKRRWEVKIFAANGLMRSGAWSAAWSMMERVDVEIKPWIPENLRRKLDALREEEIAEARRIEAQLEEEALLAERMRLQAMTPADNTMSVVLAPPPAEIEEKHEEPEPQVEEMPIEDSEAIVDSFIEDSEPTPTPIPELDSMEPLGEEFQIAPPPTKEELAQMDLFEDFLQQPPPPSPAPPVAEEAPKPVITEPVPLSTLLKNYTVFQIKSKGPLVVIFLLAAAVLFAAYKVSLMAQFSQQPEPTVHQAFPEIAEEQFFKTISITRIETTTSLSVATVTEQVLETTTALSVETVTETQHSIATETSLSIVTEQLVETSTAVVIESFTETKTEHLHVLGTSTIRSVSTTTETETLSFPVVTVTQTLPVETTTQSILLSLEPVTHVSTVYLAAVGTPAAIVQNHARIPIQVSSAPESIQSASTTVSAPSFQESIIPSELSMESETLSEAVAAEAPQVEELDIAEDDGVTDIEPSLSASASEPTDSLPTQLAEEIIPESVEEGPAAASEVDNPTGSSISEEPSPTVEPEAILGEEAVSEAAEVSEDVDAGAL